MLYISGFWVSTDLKNECLCPNDFENHKHVLYSLICMRYTWERQMDHHITFLKSGEFGTKPHEWNKLSKIRQTQTAYSNFDTISQNDRLKIRMYIVHEKVRKANLEWNFKNGYIQIIFKHFKSYIPNTLISTQTIIPYSKAIQKRDFIQRHLLAFVVGY